MFCNSALAFSLLLAGGALARIPLSQGFRRAGGAPTSLPACGGALQSNDYQESRGRRPLFRFCPTPSESELSSGPPRNEISIAYAMLTP